MTFEDLNSLYQGEVVIFTRVDEMTNLHHDYVVGDELCFLEYNEHTDYYNFLRLDSGAPNICHFSLGISDYIERKIIVLRDNKLKELGI